MHWLLGIALVLAGEQSGPSGTSVTWISPELTGQSLLAVSGSGRHVWAVGDRGTILRSDDDGTSWVSVESGTMADLHAVWASGTQEVWVAGGEGTLLRSRDGGIRWEKLDAHGVASLWSVWGSSNRDVYVVGSEGSILCMKNGNTAFQLYRPLGTTSETFTKVHGSSASEVYVGGDQGSLLVSRDGGVHWTVRLEQTPPRGSSGSESKPRSGRQIWTVTGHAPGQLVAVMTVWYQGRKGSASNSLLTGTRDGGLSWKPSHIHPPQSLWATYGPFFASDQGKIYGVVTFDRDQAPKYPQQGLVLSPDGGATFEQRSLFDAPALYGLWRNPSGILFVVGAGGTILRSSDEGLSWREKNKYPFGKEDLHALWTTPQNDLWAVGQNCKVLHSANGGQTFEVSRPCPSGEDTDLQFIWGSTTDDLYVSGASVYFSDDRGKHFRLVTPARDSKAQWRVWGSSSDDVYASGCGVWHSTDRARSWQQVYGAAPPSECSSVDDVFGSARDDVYIHNQAGLAHTSSQGARWEIRSSPKASHLFWELDDHNLFAFGSDQQLLLSADGARTWQPLAFPVPSHAYPMAVAHRNNELYVLVGGARPPGNQVVLLRSADHGETWNTTAVLPWGCQALAVTKEKRVWVGGWRGLLGRIH